MFRRTATVLRASLFAAALLLLGAPFARASTISCGFGGSQTQSTGCHSGITDGLFNFTAYALTLSFSAVHGPFDVSVTNTLTSQSALTQSQRLSNFPGYTCVTLDGINCVDFEVTAPPPGPNTWTGFYDIAIVWFTDTNSAFPNDPGNRIRILHNRGDVAGNGFDTDITVLGSYFPGFPGVPDPGIGGRDDNFQSFLVAQTPAVVPEPTTMVLLGSGLALALRRGRSRR